MRQIRGSATATSLLGCCTLLLVLLNQFHKCDAFYGSEGGRPMFDVPILPALIPFSAFIFVRFGEQVVPFQAKKLNSEYDYIVGEYSTFWHRSTYRSSSFEDESEVPRVEIE